MAKFQIIGEPIADMLEELDRIGGDLKPAVNEVLEKTQKLISDNVLIAAKAYDHKGGGLKGYAEGQMYQQINTDDSVTWEGDTAEVQAGFKLDPQGGYHSIFIMYGTPKINKDTKVYNAIRGARTKTRIKELQAEIMNKYLKLGK